MLGVLTLAMAACGPKPMRQCDPGYDYFPSFDDCLLRLESSVRSDGDAAEAGPVDSGVDARADSGVDTGADSGVDTGADIQVACGAGTTRCGADCVTIATDPSHCGACERRCTTTVANASATCAMGMCGFECAAGFELVGAACELRVPRAIGPMTSATVTSQRPTLEWELPMGISEASVDVCRDRAMTMGCVTLSATGTSARPTSALTPGVWFWRVRGRVAGVLGARTSPVWWFRVGHGDAMVDTFHGVELDVNGDGWADVAAGTDDGSGDPRVVVFLGSSIGVSMTPQRELFSIAPFEGFGARVAAAGDVNGDGFVDLLVAASAATVAGRRVGQVRVFHGGASGISAVPSAQIDGEAVDAQFGSSIASTGDFNGDGYADVVVGARFFDDGSALSAGRVSLFFGSSRGLVTPAARSWNGANQQAFLGTAVGGGGDVNGDRRSDFIVAAPYASEGGRSNNGAVYLYLGARTAPATSSQALVGPADGAQLGAGIGWLGDITGDGLCDIAVGLPTDMGSPGHAGVVRFHGGTSSGVSASPLAVLVGFDEAGRWHEAVSGVGDVNGDGRGDVAVGHTPTMSYSAGGVRLYFGRTTGVASMPDWSIDGGVGVGGRTFPIGSIAALGGHFDGDHLADVLVLSPCANTSTALRQTGRLSWFAGRPTGLSMMPLLEIDGTASGQCLGSSQFGLRTAW